MLLDQRPLLLGRLAAAEPESLGALCELVVEPAGKQKCSDLSPKDRVNDAIRRFLAVGVALGSVHWSQ